MVKLILKIKNLLILLFINSQLMAQSPKKKYHEIETLYMYKDIQSHKRHMFSIFNDSQSYINGYVKHPIYFTYHIGHHYNYYDGPTYFTQSNLKKFTDTIYYLSTLSDDSEDRITIYDDMGNKNEIIRSHGRIYFYYDFRDAHSFDIDLALRMVASIRENLHNLNN